MNQAKYYMSIIDGLYSDDGVKCVVKQCAKILLCTGLKYIGQQTDNETLAWMGSVGQSYFSILFIFDLIDI
jgi:hypothetical protein